MGANPMTTKTNVWSYRSNLSSSLSARDIVGYDVHATDGEIGKIDESSADTSRQYLVVDTGFWIFGKKRMIPAGVVTSVNHDEQAVAVAMTKDQIKSAPDFDKQQPYDERDYDTFANYYGDYGW
jgi:hypothetical protein